METDLDGLSKKKYPYTGYGEDQKEGVDLKKRSARMHAIHERTMPTKHGQVCETPSLPVSKPRNKLREIIGIDRGFDIQRTRPRAFLLVKAHSNNREKRKREGPWNILF